MGYGKTSAVLAKKYLSYRFDTRGPQVEEIRKRFGLGLCSVAILTPEGEQVAKLLDHPAPEKVYMAVDGAPEFKAGMEELKKLKDKGINKSNSAAIGTALKRIGAMPGNEARETILEYTKDDTANDVLQPLAIRALYRQVEAAPNLVEWLTDKRAPIKSAASAALIGMELAALPALLDGIGSTDADVRGASFVVAANITKAPKIQRDSGFWRTGKDDVRSKALSEWRDWHKAKTEPKKKD